MGLSQNKLILDYLKEHKSIEPLTALREFGCLRLAARISELKKMGYNIISERVNTIGRVTGNHVQFAKYTLQHDTPIQ